MEENFLPTLKSFSGREWINWTHHINEDDDTLCMCYM